MMLTRPDPDALLAGPLGQWLAGQETDRAATRAKVGQRRFYGWVAIACVAVFTMIVSRSIFMTAQFGFFTWMGMQAWLHFTRKPMIDRLKGGINGAIAQALELDYQLDVIDTRGFSTALTFEMLPGHDDASLEDQWSGLLGNQQFTLHEAKLTEEQGSGKNRRTVTVFEGNVMSIGFARNFIGTTLIERRSRHLGFFGGQKDGISINGTELKRVAMVDPRFEEDFTIWSDDGVEARYLVHPEYVERLMALETAFSGQNIRALFFGGALTVVLENGNMFESGSLDAGDDRMLLEKTINQFWTLAELAQQLNERERAGFN